MLQFRRMDERSDHHSASEAAAQGSSPDKTQSSPTGSTGEAAPKASWMRRMYDQLMVWAAAPGGIWVLFFVAFIESSVFPIPPDLLLIAMGIAQPQRWIRLALVCTIGSVLGGIAGYGIGWGFWASVQDLLIPSVFSAENFDKVTGYYKEHGLPVVFLAAFTPIPYKVFTIVGGIAKLNLFGFAIASFIGRGARFFIVAYIVQRFGPKAREIIERHFAIATLIGGLLVVAAYYALKMLRH